MGFFFLKLETYCILIHIIIGGACMQIAKILVKKIQGIWLRNGNFLPLNVQLV